MLHLRIVVSTDQVGTVLVRAKPFATRSVNNDAVDVDVGQQIVGIVGTIVARHLVLYDAQRVVGYAFLVQVDGTHIRAYPDVAFLVLTAALCSVGHEVDAVLIGHAAVLDYLVRRRVVAADVWAEPVGIGKPQASVAVEEGTSHDVHRLASAFHQLVTFDAFPRAVSIPSDDGVGSTTVQAVEVALTVEDGTVRTHVVGVAVACR